MATKTILRSVGGVNDVRAALSNSTLRRLLSIGSNWTKLRVGVRMSILDSGGNITGSPRFVIGLCASSGNPVNNGSATTGHFVGEIGRASCRERV